VRNLGLGLLFAAAVFGIIAIAVTILFPKAIYNENARRAIGACFITAAALLVIGLVLLAVEML
jgi:hypothetical protein